MMHEAGGQLRNQQTQRKRGLREMSHPARHFSAPVDGQRDGWSSGKDVRNVFQPWLALRQLLLQVCPASRGVAEAVQEDKSCGPTITGGSCSRGRCCLAGRPKHRGQRQHCCCLMPHGSAASTLLNRTIAVSPFSDDLPCPFTKFTKETSLCETKTR